MNLGGDTGSDMSYISWASGSNITSPENRFQQNLSKLPASYPIGVASSFIFLYSNYSLKYYLFVFLESAFPTSISAQ